MQQQQAPHVLCAFSTDLSMRSVSSMSATALAGAAAITGVQLPASFPTVKWQLESFHELVDADVLEQGPALRRSVVEGDARTALAGGARAAQALPIGRVWAMTEVTFNPTVSEEEELVYAHMLHAPPAPAPPANGANGSSSSNTNTYNASTENSALEKSNMVHGSRSSHRPRSLEKRLSTRPAGLASKKPMGARSTRLNASLWMVRDARTAARKKAVARTHDTTTEAATRPPYSDTPYGSRCPAADQTTQQQAGQ